MDKFKWKIEYETGNEIIDSQHKELFEKIDNLLISIYEGRERDEVFYFEKFLQTYVNKHLMTEEIILKKNNYPDYEEHLKEHAAYRMIAKDIERELHKEGPSLYIAVRVEKEIRSWWENHILKTDLKFAPFLKEKI